MAKLGLSRLLQGVVAVFAVTFFVFVLLNVSGDPVSTLLPEDATQQERDAYRVKLGLDRPILVQYVLFVRNAATGDFGESFRSGEPAMQSVLRFLPSSAELAIAALLIGTLISFPLGVLAAVHRGSVIDTVAVLLSVLGQSLPVFWTGLLLILLFAVDLRWLPVGGRGDPANLVLPAVTMGWYVSALMTRLVRSAVLDVLSEEYVRVARGKGLSEWRVISRHVLPNALVPLLTVYGLQAGSLLTSAVVTETTFSWPGVGRAAVFAVSGRDYPVVLAAVFLFTVIFVAINFVIDVLYGIVDPRVRH